MISKNKLKRELTKALYEADPETKYKNGIKYHVTICYPMVKFRHALAELPPLFPQLTDCSFTFPEENIKNQLTACILKTSDRRLRLTYDYKTDKVDCFCIGKDCDAITKTIDVTDLQKAITELLPQKKKVVIVRRK